MSASRMPWPVSVTRMTTVPGLGFQCCAERQRTAVGHGVHGIENQVEQALLELVGVTADVGQTVRDAGGQADLAQFEAVPGQHDAAIQYLVDRHRTDRYR